MKVGALADCVKKWLTVDQIKWWGEFLDKEKRYRGKWNTASEEYLSEAKKSRWYLDKLKKHRPISEPREQDQDQEESENNLVHLLNKANQCPKVSFRTLLHNHQAYFHRSMSDNKLVRNL